MVLKYNTSIFLTSENQRKQDISLKNWEEKWEKDKLSTVKFLLLFTASLVLL